MFEGASFRLKNDFSGMLDTGFLSCHRGTMHRSTTVQTLNQRFAFIAEYWSGVIAFVQDRVVFLFCQCHLELDKRIGLIYGEVLAREICCHYVYF